MKASHVSEEKPLTDSKHSTQLTASVKLEENNENNEANGECLF